MTNASFDDIPNKYKHKLNFNYFVPPRWWFLYMFFLGKVGGKYWYDGKFRGLLMYREQKP